MTPGFNFMIFMNKNQKSLQSLKKQPKKWKRKKKEKGKKLDVFFEENQPDNTYNIIARYLIQIKRI